ncbi:MAG: phytanoyl-CoA dioxygenase family protein [Alphaproteobacteria bacterium]|nr:phytanoyl-CoA dioxygenase family protein [Alphaproteobacteria bacterium]
MSKSFAANPVIGNNFLNRIGLHAGRAAVAHAMAKVRWALLAWQVPPDLRKTFQAQGFVVVPDVLPEEEFNALVSQVGSQQACEVRECIQGDTLTHRILLDDRALAQLSHVQKLLHHPLFEPLLTYCGANRKRPLHYVQSIKNGAVEGNDDPQKALHSDTFHPTMKSWFFLGDVPMDKGPFTYVPGSNRLTRKRLAWEYRRSLTARSDPDGYSERGSLRVNRDDLRALGLPDPVSLAVQKNTLVVANTCGFHCRGRAQAGTNRLEIWSFSRTNPFNPFPGIGSKLASKLEHRGAKALWRWLDRKAEAKGTLSSWHRVPAHVMSSQSVQK